ncbi:glycosyltransferase [Peribacillus sp. NPDC097675]|uniref:glycosyltransferase n=1 Tax=Peribacillus sp. NPDC097675 TaxID=3390618 RepID=UPI003CFD13D7
MIFVIDSLVGAGAEKSLITLLSSIDHSKYSIDLMLFAHGELLESLLPEEINILKPLKYTEFSNMNLKNSLIYSIRKFNFRMLYSRIKYSVNIRSKKYSNPQKARLYWEAVSSVIEKNHKEYDIAISYAQGIPTFYVADKITAKKKFAWVNVSYRLDNKERDFQAEYYKCYEKIVAVSDSTKKIFLETFPFYNEKINVMYDINNPDLLKEMAENGVGYEDNFEGLRILTIGRLAHQKGYDIALKTCRLLKEKGINFKWYVLGKGPLKFEIEKYIRNYNLENHIKLLGVNANPYPFIKGCDIYVQTSKFEGFGLAIAEARSLNKPVVTTRFDSVYSQMIDGKNGLVVDMNEDAVYHGILRLINDKELKENIINYLIKEKKGNIEEIEKFYKMVD